MKLNCLIVDDEPIARKGLREYVGDIAFLNLVGECEDAVKAAAILSEQQIDLLLLDIQMPKISGVDFIRNLKNPPLVIFTTAYPEFALEGYALDVTDYLLKPITFERFLKAAQKALDVHILRHGGKSSSEREFFFIKSDGKFEKIYFADVLYVEGMQNYVTIHTRQRKFIAYMTMTSIEGQLPSNRFIKVHKSFIIGIPHVKAIEGNEVLIENTRIPISRSLREEVVGAILGDNLFKRES